MASEDYDGTICSHHKSGLKRRSRHPATAADSSGYVCTRPNMWTTFLRRSKKAKRSRHQTSHDYRNWVAKVERGGRPHWNFVAEVGGDSLRVLDTQDDLSTGRFQQKWVWGNGKVFVCRELRGRVMDIMKSGRHAFISNFPPDFTEYHLRKMFRAIDAVYFRKSLIPWFGVHFTENNIEFGDDPQMVQDLTTAYVTEGNPNLYAIRLCFVKETWQSDRFKNGKGWPKHSDGVPCFSRLEKMVMTMSHELVHVMCGVNHLKKGSLVYDRWNHGQKFLNLTNNFFGHNKGNSHYGDQDHESVD